MTALHATLSRDSLKVADLARIYEDYANAGHAAAPDFFKTLIAEIQLDDPVTQPRAAKLITLYATDKSHPKTPPHPHTLTPRQHEIIIEILGNASSWISRILFCQLYAHIDCPPEHTEILHEQLTRCAADKRTIIRSWAITALVRLGKTHAAYAAESVAHLRALKADPSASAQARLRRILAAR